MANERDRAKAFGRQQHGLALEIPYKLGEGRVSLAERPVCIDSWLRTKCFLKADYEARLTDRSWPRRGGPPLLCKG